MPRGDLGFEREIELTQMARFTPSPEQRSDSAGLNRSAIALDVHRIHKLATPLLPVDYL